MRQTSILNGVKREWQLHGPSNIVILKNDCSESLNSTGIRCCLCILFRSTRFDCSTLWIFGFFIFDRLPREFCGKTTEAISFRIFRYRTNVIRSYSIRAKSCRSCPTVAKCHINYIKRCRLSTLAGVGINFSNWIHNLNGCSMYNAQQSSLIFWTSAQWRWWNCSFSRCVDEVASIDFVRFSLFCFDLFSLDIQTTTLNSNRVFVIFFSFAFTGIWHRNRYT